MTIFAANLSRGLMSETTMFSRITHEPKVPIKGGDAIANCSLSY